MDSIITDYDQVRNQKLRKKLKHQGFSSIFQMHVLEYPEIQPLLETSPRYRKCHVRHGITIISASGNVYWKSFMGEYETSGFGQYIEMMFRILLFRSALPFICLLFFRIIGFSFHFCFPRFFLLFPFQENVIRYSKCSSSNATDHRRLTRLYTKTQVTPRFILDS